MQIHFLTTDKKIADETSDFLKNWEASNAHIYQLSSGSTGKPKKFEIDKSVMRSSAHMTGEFFQFSKGQTALLCISPAFIGGKMMIVRSIEFDLNLYTTDVSSTPLKNLNKPINFAAMVPLQVSESIKHHPEKLNLIENLIIGGAPVSKKLEASLQHVNCKAYSTYGMTETISHIALKRLNNKNESFNAIGKTTFDTKEGCLVIKAPDLNIEELVTNDIVELLSPTQFNWIGRSDFTINSGGIKIQPELVEHKLDILIPKASFIISSLPDEKLGQRVILIAAIEMKPLIDQHKIKDLLDKYENPKEIYFVNELATTSSGKIDRLATLRMINER
jgi:O-succinylbenzoic acid--CoA ligase